MKIRDIFISLHIYQAISFQHYIIFILTLISFGMSDFNLTVVVSSWTCVDTALVRIPLSSPVFAVCLCVLWKRRHQQQQAHMTQTQDFQAVEAKWNVVCLGPQPSLPLGLWPRWTVIKQGCAESALHISSASAFTLFLFMLLYSRFFFFCLSGDHSHMSVFVSTAYGAWKSCFRARGFPNREPPPLGGKGRESKRWAWDKDTEWEEGDRCTPAVWKNIWMLVAVV